MNPGGSSTSEKEITSKWSRARALTPAQPHPRDLPLCSTWHPLPVRRCPGCRTHAAGSPGPQHGDGGDTYPLAPQGDAGRLEVRELDACSLRNSLGEKLRRPRCGSERAQG